METRNERDRHQGMNGTLPRSAPANEFNCEMSSGHFVMRYRSRKRERMVAHVSQNIEEHVRMVAQLRRERMIAHNLANTPLLGQV